MRADPEYLRRYYTSLSDEALLDLDRADLIEVAQGYYDAEISKRGLARSNDVPLAEDPLVLSAAPDVPLDQDFETDWQSPDEECMPEWLGEAAEVYSVVVVPSQAEEERVSDARQILEAARIPSYLELVELSVAEKRPVAATHRWRLLVPGKLGLRAMSTLERALSNADFEEGWRAHLESCSDDELASMHPRAVFCSLFDRVDRVTRAYEEEIARRRR